jgi:DNA-binding GntR family transcriptional regulator
LLVFGRFQINQSALAEYYGVSRTIAHEILTGLENMGFVRLGSNARWYAGPLTFEGVKESYELRWLLEPVALRQAAPNVTDEEILKKRDRIDRVLRDGKPSPEHLSAIEADLHNDIVLRCANQQMRRVLIHCQLPIITTFGTVTRDPHGSNGGSGVPEALIEHDKVLGLLLDKRIDAAAGALYDHVCHAFELCSPHFKNLPPLPEGRVPPYMTLVRHR